MTSASDDFNDLRQSHIGRLLLRAHRDFSARAAELLHERGYPNIALRHIDLVPHIDVDGTRATVLAERTGMTKQGMGKLVAELEQQHLVERVPDPTDGRAQLIGFTVEGRRFLAIALDVTQVLEAEYRELLGHQRFGELRTALHLITGGSVTHARKAGP